MVVLEVTEKRFEVMMGKFCRLLEPVSASSTSFAITSLAFWVPSETPIPR
jgi:hypothetical protein